MTNSEMSGGAGGTMGATLIETTNEKGEVHIFEKIDEYEVAGSRYALMIYQGTPEDAEAALKDSEAADADEADDEDEDLDYDEEVVIMRIVVEDDGEAFEAIEDEDELDRVISHIEKMSEEGNGPLFEFLTPGRENQEEEDDA